MYYVKDLVTGEVQQVTSQNKLCEFTNTSIYHVRKYIDNGFIGVLNVKYTINTKNSFNVINDPLLHYYPKLLTIFEHSDHSHLYVCLTSDIVDFRKNMIRFSTRVLNYEEIDYPSFKVRYKDFNWKNIYANVWENKIFSPLKRVEIKSNKKGDDMGELTFKEDILYSSSLKDINRSIDLIKKALGKDLVEIVDVSINNYLEKINILDNKRMEVVSREATMSSDVIIAKNVLIWLLVINNFELVDNVFIQKHPSIKSDDDTLIGFKKLVLKKYNSDDITVDINNITSVNDIDDIKRILGISTRDTQTPSVKIDRKVASYIGNKFAKQDKISVYKKEDIYCLIRGLFKIGFEVEDEVSFKTENVMKDKSIKSNKEEFMHDSVSLTDDDIEYMNDVFERYLNKKTEIVDDDRQPIDFTSAYKFFEKYAAYEKEVVNKYDDTLMKMAFNSASDSHCHKRKVGAVLALENRCIANGYNGTCEGEDNACEDTILTCGFCDEQLTDGTWAPGDNHCDEARVENRIKTKDSVVHAEQNVLSFAAKYGISTNECTMYVTTAPCLKCASLLISAGIKEVVYSDIYRSKDGLELLKRRGVIVRQCSVTMV